MMKPVFLVWAAALTGGILAGCSKPSTPTTADVEASPAPDPAPAATPMPASPAVDPLTGWTTIEAADGGVRLRLPSEPERRESIGVTSKGPTHAEELRVREDGRNWEVIVTTLPTAAVDQGPTPHDVLRRFARARVRQRAAAPDEFRSIEAPLPTGEQRFTVPGSLGVSEEQLAAERHTLYGNVVVTLHAEATAAAVHGDADLRNETEAFLASLEMLKPAPARSTWQDPPFPQDARERALLEARIKNWLRFEEP